MTIPLGVLALGAIFSGMVWYNSFFETEGVQKFFGMPEVAAAHGETHGEVEAGHAEVADHAEAEGEHATVVDPATVGQGAIYMHPDNHVMHEAHSVPAWVKVSPFIAMLSGFALAWLMYIRNPGAPAKLAAQQPGLYQFLLNKWYFDELYNAVFVRPARWIGSKLWTAGDGAVIDGAINGLALGIIPRMTRFAGRVQSGYLFHYAFAMVIGIVGLLIWVMLRGAQ